MNLKLVTGFTTAAATALVVSGISAPAEAASFGATGISFDSDTLVNFKFVDSHGMNQSTLGVYDTAVSLVSPVATLFSEVQRSDDGATNDWRGTLGTTVLGSGSVDFLFLAGKTYTLGLDSGVDGRVYSTTSLNSDPYSVQAQFTGSIIPGATVNFEDQGRGGHIDFNDFNVEAQAVPEPTTMVGLALAGLGFAAKRRRAAAQ